jgi:hypothetical protein
MENYKHSTKYVLYKNEYLESAQYNSGPFN